MARFSADATRNAKSYLAYEAQKAKSIAATERAIAKEAKEQERAAKAAAKTAEAQRKASLVTLPGLEKSIAGTREWASANAGLLSTATAVTGAVIGIGIALKKTVDEVVEYGDQVQKLKTITGQSAEATSNTIQLADDARISYDKLTVSLQYASKNGVDTSINGLAKLSEQYKDLAPGIERTEFLTKTFGKSGVEMGKILEMDSKAIRDFKANAGQILTEKDLANIKAYNHSLDTLQDTFTSARMSFGKTVMPFGTEALDGLNVWIRAFNTMHDKHISFNKALNESIIEVAKEKAAFLGAGDAADDMGDGLDNLVDKQKEAEEQAKRMTSAYQGLLSAMFDISKNDEQHLKDLDDLTKKEADNDQKRADALHDYLQTKDKIAASDDKAAEKLKANTDATIEYQKKIKELDSDLADIGKNREDLSKKESEAANKRIYDLEQSRLAGDGVINADEYKFLQDEAVGLGLVSRAAADRAIAESNAADQRVASFMKVQQPMLTDLQIMQELMKYSGTMVDFGINYTSNTPSGLGSSGNTYGTNGINYSSSFGSGQGSPMSVPNAAHAMGTDGWLTVPSGYPNDSYNVGLSSGETYSVNKSGGGGISIGQITIINPVPEKSADSVRKALIQKSVTGRSS